MLSLLCAVVAAVETGHGHGHKRGHAHVHVREEALGAAHLRADFEDYGKSRSSSYLEDYGTTKSQPQDTTDYVSYQETWQAILNEMKKLDDLGCPDEVDPIWRRYNQTVEDIQAAGSSDAKKLVQKHLAQLDMLEALKEKLRFCNHGGGNGQGGGGRATKLNVMFDGNTPCFDEDKDSVFGSTMKRKTDELERKFKAHNADFNDIKKRVRANAAAATTDGPLAITMAEELIDAQNETLVDGALMIENFINAGKTALLAVMPEFERSLQYFRNCTGKIKNHGVKYMNAAKAEVELVKNRPSITAANYDEFKQKMAFWKTKTGSRFTSYKEVRDDVIGKCGTAASTDLTEAARQLRKIVHGLTKTYDELLDMRMLDHEELVGDVVVGVGLETPPTR